MDASGIQAASGMKTKGSRLNDVALLFCAIAGGVAGLAHGGLVLPVLWVGAVVLAWRARRHAAAVIEVFPADDRLTLVHLDGRRDVIQVRSARMGRCWAAVSGINDASGRRMRQLFFIDHFERPDDFRRFRRWLRESLRPCDSDADAGWSAWRPRWFPGSRD